MKVSAMFQAFNNTNLIDVVNAHVKVEEGASVSNVIITEMVLTGFENPVKVDISVEVSVEGAASERVIYITGSRNGNVAKMAMGIIDFATGVVRLDERVEHISGAVEVQC